MDDGPSMRRERRPEAGGGIDDLIRAAQQGDLLAFEQVVLTCQRELRLFVAARANGADQVEEICQAAFVVAWERLNDYQLRGTFVSWLKGIAHNRLREDFRERRRHTGLPGDELDQILDDELAERLEASRDFERDRLTLLKHCLDGVGERGRQLLLRHHAQGLPLTVLAQQFKRTRAAIGKALFTLRRSVKECMDREREVQA